MAPKSEELQRAHRLSRHLNTASQPDRARVLMD
jgi:hypothetical protein